MFSRNKKSYAFSSLGQTLLRNHALLRMAVAWLPLSPSYSGNLYEADNVAMGLNIATSVHHKSATDTAADDATLLLHAFVNGADDAFPHYINVCWL